MRQDFRGCAFTAATAESHVGSRAQEAAQSYRDDVRGLLRELAAGAGASDPERLARQLQLIYDGGGAAAKADGDGSITAPARDAVRVLVDASRS